MMIHALFQTQAVADSVGPGGGLLDGFLILATDDIGTNVALTLLVVLSLWLVRKMVRRLIFRAVDDRALQYRWGKAVSYATAALGVVFIATLWVDGLRQVGTFLGLFSAGLAIALKDVLVDVAGWLILMTKPPFAPGDRIQIGPHAGDVVDISVLHFTLLEIGNWVEADQSTGRIVRIPNAKILTDPIANYTSEFPYLWHEIPVVVTFESNWRKAKKLLLGIVLEATHESSKRAEEALRRQPNQMLISYATTTATVYTSVLDHGICLTMRFLTEPRKRRDAHQALWEAVLDAFQAEPDIDLAYPTTRIFNPGGSLFLPEQAPPT